MRIGIVDSEVDETVRCQSYRLEKIRGSATTARKRDGPGIRPTERWEGEEQRFRYF